MIKQWKEVKKEVFVSTLSQGHILRSRLASAHAVFFLYLLFIGSLQKLEMMLTRRRTFPTLSPESVALS